MSGNRAEVNDIRLFALSQQRNRCTGHINGAAEIQPQNAIEQIIRELLDLLALDQIASRGRLTTSSTAELELRLV